MIVWITGISGAGKTTVGSRLVSELKRLGKNTVFLDGDILRTIFQSANVKTSYDRDSRIDLALKYSKLCNFLSKSGFDVVIATISMYDEVYCWNSENLDNYYEIFLKVPKKVVMHRDSKGIYADFKIGKVKNVAGFDLKVDFPKKSTLVIENHGSNDPTDAVNQILRVLDAS